MRAPKCPHCGREIRVVIITQVDADVDDDAEDLADEMADDDGPE